MTQFSGDFVLRVSGDSMFAQNYRFDMANNDVCMYVLVNTYVHIYAYIHTAGFSVRRIFPTGRLKDVISPRLRGLRGQSLNHNVCTAHHDHEKKNLE